MLKKHIHTKRPLMTRAAKHGFLMVLNTSKESYNHYFHKYFYTYGGATDVKTLQEFINEYDSDLCGDVDVYDSSICPCIICLDLDEDEIL